MNAVTGSLVGLLAIDQSALLLGRGNDITQDDVSRSALPKEESICQPCNARLQQRELPA